MKFHRVIFSITALLIGVTVPSVAQSDPVDPMIGGYVLGNSAELIQIYAPYDSLGQDIVSLRMYDWDSSGSTLDTNFAEHPYSASVGHFGPKQMDVATGDFNADGRDDIVAVWEDSGHSITVAIPQVDSTGTLDWSASHTLNSGPGALYYDAGIAPHGISGIRVVTAELDASPGTEFVVAYVTASAQVRLVMYKTDPLTLAPIPIDSVVDNDTLWVTRTSPCNERQHDFDITAGDFDGDWMDEILLIGEREDIHHEWVLFGSVFKYDSDIVDFTRRGGTDSLAWDTDNQGVANNLVDRIAVTSGNFHMSDRDQAVLFTHFNVNDGNCNTWGRHSGRLFGLTIAADLSSISVSKKSGQIGWAWWDEGGGLYETSAHSLTAGDLNPDGRDEFVLKSGNQLSVYEWRDSTSDLVRLVSLYEGYTKPQLGKFDFYTDSRREVVIADLDADSSQDSWQPELIVMHRRVSGSTGWHLWVFQADTNTSGDIIGMTERAETFMPDRAGPLVFAAGDFDGDGIRLGQPIHHSFIHRSEPLVVLNAPPAHFDVVNDSIFDISRLADCYLDGDCLNFKAEYTVTSSVETTTESRHTCDWSMSASVGGETGGLGYKIGAKLTTAYGETNTRFSGVTATHETELNTGVSGGDLVYGNTVPYDVWEYPIQSPGSDTGFFVIVRPDEDNSTNTWEPPSSSSSTDYIPTHEFGNILSYPANISELLSRGDVVDTLGVGTEWAISPGVSEQHWHIGIDTITTDVNQRTQTSSMSLEVEAEAWGLEMSATGSMGVENFASRETTIGNGLDMDVWFGGLLAPYGPGWQYWVTPVFYWSTNGALVLDYVVRTTTVNSWWDSEYGQLPDATLLLPYRHYPEMGFSLAPDTTFRRWSPGIYFRPEVPVSGKPVTIRFRVHNYSLVPLAGGMEARLYLNDPLCGGTPLVNTGGDSAIISLASIGPRQFQELEFTWDNWEGAPGDSRIFVVLDSDSLVAEVHENNNKGWKGLFTQSAPPPACTPPCPIVVAGDVNESSAITSADIIYCVGYVFKGGPEPAPCAANGDVNCTGTVTSADIIYLVGHVFKGGPAPCDICSESTMPCS